MTFRYFTSYYIAVQTLAHYPHINPLHPYKLHAFPKELLRQNPAKTTRKNKNDPPIE